MLCRSDKSQVSKKESIKRASCLILAVFLILPPLPAQAWSEGGHHLIAVMAFRKLPADKRVELIRILNAHPRFEQDFELSKKVRNEDEWLIDRAGYWPGVARSQPEYNRPNWHYLLGSSLVLGNCQVPERLCDCRPDATLATKDLHILGGVSGCRRPSAMSCWFAIR